MYINICMCCISEFAVYRARVSTLTLTRDIDIANLSIHLSVCLYVRDVPVLDENGLTYCHSFFTTQ